MPRALLDETRLHPAIRDTVANWHADIVHNVQAASQSHPLYSYQHFVYSIVR